jgi:hypothetical protein
MNAPSLGFLGTGRGHLAFSWTGGRMTVLERRGRVWNSGNIAFIANARQRLRPKRCLGGFIFTL